MENCAAGDSGVMTGVHIVFSHLLVGSVALKGSIYYYSPSLSIYPSAQQQSQEEPNK
jgi:hypothetical protein